MPFDLWEYDTALDPAAPQRRPRDCYSKERPSGQTHISLERFHGNRPVGPPPHPVGILLRGGKGSQSRPTFVSLPSGPASACSPNHRPLNIVAKHLASVKKSGAMPSRQSQVDRPESDLGFGLFLRNRHNDLNHRARTRSALDHQPATEESHPLPDAFQTEAPLLDRLRVEPDSPVLHFIDNQFRRLPHKPENIVGPCVRPGMTVMDVGCGRGLFSIAMVKDGVPVSSVGAAR